MCPVRYSSLQILILPLLTPHNFMITIITRYVYLKPKAAYKHKFTDHSKRPSIQTK